MSTENKKLTAISIDLRKKVPAECHEYLLGGVVHYLDQQNYLLLKEMIANNNGLYDLELYNQFNHHRLSLQKQPQGSGPDVSTDLIKRDKEQPEILPFDRSVMRREPRLKLATKIAIALGDKSHTAVTIDLALTSMRILLKRTHQLAVSTTVLVNFVELEQRYRQRCLRGIEYRVLRIVQTPKNTQVTLKKTSAPVGFDEWFEQWLEQKIKAEKKRLDINDQIYHKLLQSYIKFYAGYLFRPIYFLKQNAIETAYITQPALDAILFYERDQGLRFFCIENLIARFAADIRAKSFLLFLYNNSEGLHYFTHQDIKGKPLVNILAWLRQQPEWRVYLFSIKTVEQGAAPADSPQEPYQNKLDASCRQITQQCTPQDISDAFDLLDLSQHAPEDCRAISHVPDLLTHEIRDIAYLSRRQEPRVLIATDILVHIGATVYPARSVSFSVVGIKLELSDSLTHLPIRLGEEFLVTFSDWQKETAVSIDQVPYILTGITYEHRKYHIRGYRDPLHCSAKTDEWLRHHYTAIARDATLDEQNLEQDYFLTLFARLIVNNLETLPFFIGRDKEGARIIQAIGATRKNQKIRQHFQRQNQDDDWRPLQSLAAHLAKELSEIKRKNRSRASRLSTGVYCYRDSDDAWHSETDLSLKFPILKQNFIRTALKSEKYMFLQCHLSELNPNQDPRIDDIVEHTATLSLKRAKEVRALFNSLVAVGELVDVSHLIAHLFKPS